MGWLNVLLMPCRKVCILDTFPISDFLQFDLGVEKHRFQNRIRPTPKQQSWQADCMDASGYRCRDRERFPIRFCLFTDDTDIFDPRDIFLEIH